MSRRISVSEIDDLISQHRILAETRRHFLGTCTAGLGAMFLGTLSARPAWSAQAQDQDQTQDGEQRLDFRRDPTRPLAPLPPQFAPKARRVIYLHMVGGPSQLELFEHKPVLTKYDGQECPKSFLEGKRFAFITGIPKLMGSRYPFHQCGKNGTWISDRLPFLEKHVDDLCMVHTMQTEQFNHGPAQLFIQTGNARIGYASMGSWVTYGLGSENQNLPGFIVLLSGGKIPDAGKLLWGSGYLPSVYQGVECRSKGQPILYLDSPSDVSRVERRRVLDAIDAIDHQDYVHYGDPETITRIAQYEMAFRMQVDATDAMDIHREPEAVQALYGAKPGDSSFANNCLVARRLAERGVRFIQLYHFGWDTHGGARDKDSLGQGLSDRCRETDQPIAALLGDLKARGMLDDTLVVWGGEFGRTSMREDRGGVIAKYPGRDHNPSSFTMWLAGGGAKPGLSYGETDDLGYEVAADPVQVRDLHATILYLLGFDYNKLDYPYQGLNQKLTGVKPARVVGELLA